MEIKTKMNKQNLIKLKKFCTTKETTNKTKTQPEEWEKIFANSAINKGLIPIQYQKNEQPSQKMVRRYIDGQEAHKKMLNITNY